MLALKRQMPLDVGFEPEMALAVVSAAASSPSATAANASTYPARATSDYDPRWGLIFYEEYHPYGTTAYRAASRAAFWRRML